MSKHIFIPRMIRLWKMNDFEKSFLINLKHTTERIVRKWPFAHTQHNTNTHSIRLTRCIYMFRWFLLAPVSHSFSLFLCLSDCSWWIGCVHISRKSMCVGWKEQPKRFYSFILSLFVVAVAVAFSFHTVFFVLFLKANQITAIYEKLKAKNVQVCEDKANIGICKKCTREIRYFFIIAIESNRTTYTTQCVCVSVNDEDEMKEKQSRADKSGEKQTHSSKYQFHLEVFPSHSFSNLFSPDSSAHSLTVVTLCGDFFTFVVVALAIWFPKWTRWIHTHRVQCRQKVEFFPIFLLLFLSSSFDFRLHTVI